MSAPTVAAIDCGTNSIRLLVATTRELDGRPALTELTREMRIVRLGEGVDATGEFSAAALQRVATALGDYVRTALELGATRVRMVATSAARDVRNRDEFVALTASALGRITAGAQAEIISGTQEAALSYRGATADTDVPGALVVDLGGGSTELVTATERYSADIGCVRITERYLTADPPTTASIAAARSAVDDALDEASAAVELGSVTRWIGVAGTFTTLAAIALRLDHYDSAAIHGATVALPVLDKICESLLAMSVAERRSIGPMHPGRADVIGGGALVALRLSQRLAAVGLTEITVSEHDILDGIALSIA